MAPTQHMF